MFRIAPALTVRGRLLRKHLPNRGTADQHLRRDVVVEHCLPAVERHLVQRAVAKPAAADAGHVVDAIEAAELRHARIHDRLNRSLLSQVTDGTVRADGERLDQVVDVIGSP